MWSWCLCLHGPGRQRNGSLARLKLPTRLQAQAPRSHSKVKVEERAAQKPAEVLKFACQAGWLGFRPFRAFGDGFTASNGRLERLYRKNPGLGLGTFARATANLGLEP